MPAGPLPHLSAHPPLGPPVWAAVILTRLPSNGDMVAVPGPACFFRHDKGFLSPLIAKMNFWSSFQFALLGHETVAVWG